MDTISYWLSRFKLSNIMEFWKSLGIHVFGIGGIPFSFYLNKCSYFNKTSILSKNVENRSLLSLAWFLQSLKFRPRKMAIKRHLMDNSIQIWKKVWLKLYLKTKSSILLSEVHDNLDLVFSLNLWSSCAHFISPKLLLHHVTKVWFKLGDSNTNDLICEMIDQRT